MRSDTGIEAAIAAADAAATDPSHWHACITAIAMATNSAGAALFHPTPAPLGGVIAATGTFLGPDQAYFDHWIRRDPWNLAARGTSIFRQAGEVRFGTDFLSNDAFLATDYYNEHARFTDSGHKLFLKVSDGRDLLTPVTHLSLSRSFSQEAFGPFEQVFATRLWPHLQRSVQIQARLSNVLFAREASEDNLAALQLPCLVVRADGQIDYASPLAEHALKQADWLRAVSGRLYRIGDLDPSHLKQLLATARAGRSAEAPFSMRGPGARLYTASVLVAPLADSDLFAAAWPHSQALLTFKLPPPTEQPGPSMKIDGVTTQERTVLGKLANGLNIREIAADLSISPTTVKKHLANLSAKTGCRNQAELVRMAFTGIVPNLQRSDHTKNIDNA